MRLTVPLLVCLSPWLALAAAGGDTREGIAAERQALVDRYAAEERECRQRFVVTACVDEVRLRRRDALAPLREREMALADRERRQHSIDKSAALTARRLAAEQRQPAPSAAQSRVRKPPPAHAASGAKPARSEAARAAEAEQRRRAAQDRLEAVQASQARVARRLAQRARQGKPVVPLPAPPGASAPGR